MSGILIYTASGDSEGTLGGLVRQGYPDVFPSTFRKAIEGATTCSNDPVCNLSLGQGRDSLNLAACHSCTLIPETSCEEFNVFLDRSVVVGTFDNREMGFYSMQLNNKNLWKNSNCKKNNTVQSESKQSKRKTIVFEDGIDVSESSISEICSSLEEWSENEIELKNISVLKTKDVFFGKHEMPLQDCTFKMTSVNELLKADLMWLQSKVALFTEDNEYYYNIVKNSDWKCYLLSDENFSVEELLKDIIGRN